MNQFVLAYQARLIGLDNQVKTLLLPESPQPIYVGFSRKSPNGAKLIEQYNQAQAAMGFSEEDYRALVQQVFDGVTPTK